MQQTLKVINIFILTICLLLTGCCHHKVSHKWKTLFPDDEWNNFSEEQLIDYWGTIQYEPHDPNPTFVQRYNPYKLLIPSGITIDIYCGSSDVLKPYIGHKVTIKGARRELVVEGHRFDEILPVKIKYEE
jgi:hypothetical protein